MPDPSPSTLTVLHSNFLQLGRRSGGQPQRAVHPRRLPVNTVMHTTLIGLEPATFRSLVRRTTSSATEPTNHGTLFVVHWTASWQWIDSVVDWECWSLPVNAGGLRVCVDVRRCCGSWRWNWNKSAVWLRRWLLIWSVVILDMLYFTVLCSHHTGYNYCLSCCSW